MPELREVLLMDYLRTPMSRSRPNQAVRDVFQARQADELLALVLKEVVARGKFLPSDIDEVITGCANQVKENFLYGGRHPIFLAGLPETVAAMGLDRQCGSSMSCVHVAFMEIATGNSDVVVACGMEHMTRIPRGSEFVIRHDELADEQEYPDHTKYDLRTGYSMIQTAQKLWEQNPDITREDMDRWSLTSHERSIKARDEGFFDEEIFPVEGILPDGSKEMIKYDQSIRTGSTMEIIRKLRTVSKKIDKEPQITPGNSSPLNAGASCCVLMSRTRTEELKIKPMARIRAVSWAGVNPGVMGQGPVPASEKALARAGLKVDDIDFWEINEAFAVVPLYVSKILGIPHERINVKGGAIALGHPLGSSGLRLVGTLARILSVEKGRYGLATACVGGGQGVATIIEKI